MSAVVCGKRTLFDDFSSPPLSKRVRCGSGSPARFSHLISENRSETRSASSGGAGCASSPLTHLQPEVFAVLRQLFPEMDDNVLQSNLEACGNNIDSAIRSLNELRLSQADLSVRATSSEEASAPSGPTPPIQTEETRALSAADVAPGMSQVGSVGNQLAGSDWVELMVREMMSAADVEDARRRTARVLKEFEKVVQQQGEEKAATFLGTLRKENGILKDHLQVLVKDSHILKRAVAIQHERQMEHEARKAEVEEMKVVVRRYEEQMRSLEMSNYALNVHLRQAQEATSMPNRFNPDIF